MQLRQQPWARLAVDVVQLELIHAHIVANSQCTVSSVHSLEQLSEQVQTCLLFIQESPLGEAPGHSEPPTISGAFTPSRGRRGPAVLEPIAALHRVARLAPAVKPLAVL